MQVQQLDDSRVQILNQQINTLGNHIQDINNIFENQYKRIVPPLIEIPENVNNEDMICYAQCQYKVGECFGCLRTWIPCVFCFCVEYPYKEINQGTQGLFSRYSRYSSTVKPGLIFVNPCTDALQTVDMRISVLDLDRQVIMTRDNVTISVDTSVYFKITNPRYAIFRVKQMQECVVQVTYSILKNTVGNFLFQDLLVKRQEIAQEMENQVEKYVENWGVSIVHIYIKDIQLSVELQVALSSAATAQRSAMAKIIGAKADVESAKLIRQSAEFINSNAAMQTRYLETLQALGTQTSSRVVFIPQDKDKNKVNHYITQGLLS